MGWYTGRDGKNVERKMTVFFDKINKSILFVPKMKMDTTLTLDGKKISEFVFDNTQAKKHIKFFYSPDAYTKDYLFTDEWEYPGHSGCKWNTELKRGGVSIWNWVGDYSFVNNANKFEMKTMDKIVQTEMTPAASDLEFGVTITPDRKVVTKFGWEMAGVKKV